LSDSTETGHDLYNPQAPTAALTLVREGSVRLLACLPASASTRQAASAEVFDSPGHFGRCMPVAAGDHVRRSRQTKREFTRPV